jgi:hypothetical protein
VREDYVLKLREAWAERADDARWLIYGFNAKTLQTLRDGNARKSRLVNLALTAQLIALLFLALSLVSVAIDALEG